MVDSGKNVASDGQCGSDDEPNWMKNFVANKDCQSQDQKIKNKKNGFG